MIAVYVFVSQLDRGGAGVLAVHGDRRAAGRGRRRGRRGHLSNILDAITALGPVRQVLPTHWEFAWADALQPDMEWAGMVKGTSVAVSFAVVFRALAFRHFRRKDIVS